MKTVTVGFLVEDGKGVMNIAEMQSGFAGLSKQFLLVVSNKYIGKSWAKWRARRNIINLFVYCIVEAEFNQSSSFG